MSTRVQAWHAFGAGAPSCTMLGEMPATSFMADTPVGVRAYSLRGADARWLRLEFGIPIEIVEPAIVQIVRREQPPVAVQMLHARCEWHLRGPHAGFVRRHVALLQIAGRTGRHDVVPHRQPAARTRHQMIEGEIVARAAELAA